MVRMAVIVVVPGMRMGCRVIDRLVVLVKRRPCLLRAMAVLGDALAGDFVGSKASEVSPTSNLVVMLVRAGEEVVMMTAGSAHMDVMARHHHLTSQAQEGQRSHQTCRKG